MKKITLCLMTVFLSLTFIPAKLKAETASIAMTSKAAEQAKANTLLSRLNEIHAMNKSRLSSPEKKVLRTEVRDIRDQLKNMSQGVYLSIGAVIIIILLLILLV